MSTSKMKKIPKRSRTLKIITNHHIDDFKIELSSIPHNQFISHGFFISPLKIWEKENIS